MSLIQWAPVLPARSAGFFHRRSVLNIVIGAYAAHMICLFIGKTRFTLTDLPGCHVLLDPTAPPPSFP